MNKITIIIICLLAVILPSVIKKILSNYVNKKALTFLQSHDYDNFYKTLDSYIAKFALYPFNLEYFKLNGAFFQENKNMIDKQIELIDTKLKMNKSQKIEFYNKAFMYYISQENKNKCKYFLEKIGALNNDKLNNDSNIIYDIYINKGNKYLDILLNEINKKDINKEELISKQMLIMQIYENMGDIKSANKYRKIIKNFYTN